MPSSIACRTYAMSMTSVCPSVKLVNCEFVITQLRSCASSVNSHWLSQWQEFIFDPHRINVP